MTSETALRASDPLRSEMVDSTLITLAVVFIAVLAGAVAWAPTSPVVGWSGIFVEAFVVGFLVCRGRRTWAPSLVPIALLVAGLGIETIRASDRAVALTLLRSYLSVVLLYFMGTLTRHDLIRRVLVIGLAIGGVLTTAVLVYLWAGYPHPKVTILDAWLYHGVRGALVPSLTTAGVEPSLNTAALVLAPLAPMAYVAALRRHAVARVGWLVLTGAVVVVIAVLSARASWLGVAVGLITASMLVPRARVATLALTLALVAAAAAVVSIDESFSGAQSLESRIELWSRAGPVLIQALPFGVGLGEFPSLLQHLYPGWAMEFVPTNPHNSWLQLDGDAGAMGLMAFAVWGTRFIRTRLRQSHVSPPGQGATAALVSYGVIGLFESLLVFSHPVSTGIFVSVASPVPWILLALMDRDASGEQAATLTE